MAAPRLLLEFPTRWRGLDRLRGLQENETQGVSGAAPGPLLGGHSSRLRPFQHCPGPPQLGGTLMVVGEEGAHSPLAPSRLPGELICGTDNSFACRPSEKNHGMTWFLICKMDITETDFLGLFED